jgi:hypothetical protein
MVRRIRFRRSVAQWLEHRSPKPGVAGSSPATPARKNKHLAHSGLDASLTGVTPGVTFQRRQVAAATGRRKTHQRPPQRRRGARQTASLPPAAVSASPNCRTRRDSSTAVVGDNSAKREPECLTVRPASLLCVDTSDGNCRAATRSAYRRAGVLMAFPRTARTMGARMARDDSTVLYT